jgi:hypothetical protein
MNERIQELARQSGALPTQDCGVPQWYIDEDEFEKFAQLIVKECLEACSRANEIRHFVPPTQQQVVLSCMDEIERTFWS